MTRSAADQNLVNRARSGDCEALNRLLVEYRPVLRSLADRQRDGVSDARGDASDVVQEVLLYVARRMADDFQGSTQAEFEAWLRKVVRSKTIDDRRHHHAVQRDVRKASSLDESNAAGVSRKNNLHDDRSSPSQQAIGKERFQQALDAIPAQNREIVRLHLIDQIAIDDIAARLGIEPDQCALRYHRGLRTLKRRLRAD